VYKITTLQPCLHAKWAACARVADVTSYARKPWN